MTTTLRRAFSRAGITKPGNPHSFRHAAVTRDAAFMSDQELKHKYGWTPSSRQLEIYSHIRLDGLNHAFRRHYGLVREPGPAATQSRRCPFCSTTNKLDEPFCTNCTKPLQFQEVLQEERKLQSVAELTAEFLALLADENPQVKTKFRALVREKGLGELFRSDVSTTKTTSDP